MRTGEQNSSSRLHSARFQYTFSHYAALLVRFSKTRFPSSPFPTSEERFQRISCQNHLFPARNAPTTPGTLLFVLIIAASEHQSSFNSALNTIFHFHCSTVCLRDLPYQQQPQSIPQAQPFIGDLYNALLRIVLLWRNNHSDCPQFPIRSRIIILERGQNF